MILSIELQETWLAVPTLADMKGLKAEIQVRTTAQHIWAEASQTLQYKHVESVPPPVRRAIYRVSALLETIDLEFERVLEQRESYRSQGATLRQDEVLNADLLEKILDQLLPAANKHTGWEIYSELLDFGIKIQQSLEILWHKDKDAILREDQTKVIYLKSGSLELLQERAKDLDERVRTGVFYNHVGLIRTALEHEYGERWRRYMIDKLSKSK